MALFDKFKLGLGKSSTSLSEGLKNIFSKKIIDDKAEVEEVVIGYSLKAMFAQLLADIPRFEIMADSKHTFYWEAQKLGISDKVKVLDYNIKNKAYYLTVSKQTENIKEPEEFLAKTDVCLREIKQNGMYHKILARYGIH